MAGFSVSGGLGVALPCASAKCFPFLKFLTTVGRGLSPRERAIIGFVRDLVNAGSVEVVENALEHVGLFVVAKKFVAQRFIIDARASNRHFHETSSWIVRRTLSC